MRWLPITYTHGRSNIGASMGATVRQHRGWCISVGFRQRLQARLHARLWAASVAGITDLPSAEDLASNSAYNSNSSLTLALLSRPRAVTRTPLSLPLASALLSASNLL